MLEKYVRELTILRTQLVVQVFAARYSLSLFKSFTVHLIIHLIQIINFNK
jgi:hypothetical protein